MLRITASRLRQTSPVNVRYGRLGCEGKDIGDRKERIDEMTKSLNDVSDMRKDKENKYVFASASQNDNKPETKRTSSNEITIFTDNFAKQIHETRHGGQIARGEYDINVTGGIRKGSLGASKEVDAYRAQYAYDGFIQYLPSFDLMSQEKLKSGLIVTSKGTTYDIRLLQEKITNFTAITPSFLKNLYDLEGLKQIPIYPNIGNFYNQ